MNLKDMHYVVAIADTGSFSKAAERCHVSQPALSTQIRKLEDYLGVRIFERGGREITLTAIGSDVLAHARRIVRESEALLATVRAAGPTETQAVSIGCFPTLAPYLFPRVVPSLVTAEPPVRFSLVEDKTARLLEALREGELDVALLALPVPVDGLEVHSLFSEEFLACVRSDHPLAARAQVCYEDLAGEDLLLLAEGHCMRDQALAVCAMQGLNYRRDYAATSLETLRQMVVAGAGVTLLPRLAVRADDPGITCVPIGPSSPSRTIAMVWSETATRAAFYAERVLPHFRDIAGEAVRAAA